MRVAKRWLRSTIGLRLACWLVACYARLVWATGRWQIEGREHLLRLLESGRPVIGAFWHGRILVMPFAWDRRAAFHMLISAHPDGRLIAGAVRHFGIDWIAGSSTEGGGAGFRTMLRQLKAGASVGITPDGPNGPAMRAKPGIVAIARVSRAAVLPVSYATSRRRILDSWDRFHLPLPFSRGLLIYGEPIEVAAKLDAAGIEACRAAIEQRLNAITAEADRRMGQDAVAPGTLSRNALRDLHRAEQGR
ncbi:MAG TPA: lysophospholipid acyltransferase family protein [Stellaceae bacterium]|nr:lysophospholipid acyltransferase family protein [Stellaceae bacterium]